MRVAASLVIDSPIQSVFAYATNPDCWPEWVSGLARVRRGWTRPLDVGATFERVDAFPGGTSAASWECIEYEPPRVLACRRLTGADACTLRLAFESVDGGTKVTLSSHGGLEEASGREPEIERAAAGKLERDLDALRRVIERRGEAAEGRRDAPDRYGKRVVF